MFALKKSVIFCTVGVLAASLASAGGKQSQQDLSRLKTAKTALAAKANGQKGYPRARLDMERLRVDNLIDQLEAGNRVDPQEIDSVLRHAGEETGR